MAIENAPEEFKVENVEETEVEVTEELQDDVQEIEVSYVEDFDPENPTEIQKQAIDMGWNPEGVQGKRAIGAEEFVDRKQFFDRISKQNREIKELREAIDLMKESDKQARKRQIEDVEKRLRTERKAALEEQDGDKFDEIEEELDKLRTEKTELDKSSAKTEQKDELFEGWVKNNSWYQDEFEMAQEANQFGQWYAQKNSSSGYTPEEFYEAIEKHVRKKFPEHFGINTRRDKPSPVASAKPGKIVKQDKYKASDLPEGGVEAMRKMIRLGIFQDEQEYLKNFFENQ